MAVKGILTSVDLGTQKRKELFLRRRHSMRELCKKERRDYAKDNTIS